MAFILETSWNGARPGSGASAARRSMRGPLEAAGGLAATVAVQLLIFALLLLRLSDVRPGPRKELGRGSTLTLIDTESVSVREADRPRAPVESPPARTQPTLAVVRALAVPEWSRVKLAVTAVAAPRSVGLPVDGSRAGASTEGGGSGMGAAIGDPYASAGIVPASALGADRRAPVSAPSPIASGAVMIDPLSLREALARFRLARPQAKGSASFVVRSLAGRTGITVGYTDGTLDKQSANLLERLLRASLRILGPRLDPVELMIGPVTI